MLCGGNHRGQRLSALPQPSRRPIASRFSARADVAFPCADYGGGDLGSTWADLVSANTGIADSRSWVCRNTPFGRVALCASSDVHRYVLDGGGR